jgi:hypothetical protein
MAATRATAEVAINTKSGLSADLPDFRDYRGMVMAATKARQAQRGTGTPRPQFAAPRHREIRNKVSGGYDDQQTTRAVAELTGASVGNAASARAKNAKATAEGEGRDRGAANLYANLIDPYREEKRGPSLAAIKNILFAKFCAASARNQILI